MDTLTIVGMSTMNVFIYAIRINEYIRDGIVAMNCNGGISKYS